MRAAAAILPRTTREDIEVWFDAVGGEHQALSRLLGECEKIRRSVSQENLDSVWRSAMEDQSLQDLLRRSFGPLIDDQPRLLPTRVLLWNSVVRGYTNDRESIGGIGLVFVVGLLWQALVPWLLSPTSGAVAAVAEQAPASVQLDTRCSGHRSLVSSQ